MRTSEWVVSGYAAYLLLTALVLRVPRPRLRRVVLLQLGSLALMAVTKALEPARAAGILRDWLPGWYLLSGYWASGLLYRGPAVGFEAALEHLDRPVFAMLGPAIARAPRVLLEFVEAAYLLCYPLVPAALTALYLCGARRRANAFWVVVLASAFASYGVIPWLGTRPPRALGWDLWIDHRHVLVRRVNLAVLHRASIQVNTFPSGHAAVAGAVALFMWSVPGAGGAVFAIFALSICIGAITGRYHYTADVVAGVLTTAGILALTG